MYKIVGKTYSGKTKDLILAAHKEGGVIACRNPERLMAKAHSLGIVGLQIVHYNEVHPGDDTPYFIDDLEAYVTSTLGSSFAGYTLSCDD